MVGLVIRALFLSLMLFPGLALAAGPQLFFVTGVEADDLLNVRAGPSADAADIGDLAPDGPGVVVVEQDERGAWGRIAWQGGSGWVSMRHLRRAFAQGPEVLRVAGVPPGDVLNVRAEPSAASAVIGDVGGNGGLIEVLGVGPDSNWGRVAQGEGGGWVALRYLVPVAVARVAGSPIPVGLVCTGTEPFWSLRLAGSDSLVFSEPGAGGAPEEDRARIRWVGSASGRAGLPAGLKAAGARDYALVLRLAACSDGMSDRPYGWHADILTGERLLTGCCRVEPGGKE